ncbi:MAG TPA: hypothetical protein VM555_05565 [Tahibacter sp.]|nr:hypothetical protein [Tahibacter sp.]
MYRSLLALGFAVFACTATAQLLAPPTHKPPPTADELKRIETIEAIGREIYRQDVLAWRATDALLAKLGERRMKEQTYGWVITTIDGGALVTFARRDPANADDEVLAEVSVLDGKRKPRVDAKAKRALSPTERAILAARHTAMAVVPVKCSQTYNTAVLPNPDGGWDVYALAASTRTQVVPMGGHARIHVNADGTKVLDIEPYSKGCLIMDIAEQRKQSGQEPAFLMTTHIVDDLPAPVHVFLNLSFDKPIVIGTQRLNWGIEKGKIIPLPTKAETEPAAPDDAGTP